MLLLWPPDVLVFDSCHQRVDLLLRHELRLTAQSAVYSVRDREPLLARRWSQAPQRADHAVAGTLGGGYRFDEQVVDVGLAVGALGGALDEHRAYMPEVLR